MAQLPTGWERQTELAPPEEQLQNAIEASGLAPKRPVRCILDGKIHRFAVAGDENTEKAGWYVAFGDNIPAGIFGSWRGSMEEKWRGVPHTRGDEPRPPLINSSPLKCSPHTWG